jgi:putative DNA primase/helicase
MQHSINFDAIPSVLRARPQWVLWRYVEREGKKTKVPFSFSGTPAKANDPSTWADFESVVKKFRAGGFDGIGFVFSQDDEFFGIDLDACRNPSTGKLTMWAQKIVDEFATYTEVSPSGYGVKLVARGSLPVGKGRSHHPKGVSTFGPKPPEIAVYDRKRYWCFTGNKLHSAPSTCEPRQEKLDAILLREFPGKAKIPKGRNDETMGTLFERLVADCAAAPNGQRSDRDFALCAAAVRHKWDREFIWQRVQNLGKFQERGRDYFDLTWQSATDRAREAQQSCLLPAGTPAITVEPTRLDLLLPVGRTDVANGRRLAQLFGHDLHWCEPWNKWLAWDRQRWAFDAERHVDAMAKGVGEAVWRQVGILLPTLDSSKVKELIAFARMTASAKGVANMVTLAKSEPGIPIVPCKLDADPWALNVQNGTLDLRTGTLQPHDPADLLTKLCPVPFDPTATCPNWERMLDTIMRGHADLITFLQRAVGYSLTGSVAEQVLFLLWGKGSNGKSTFLNALLDSLGDDYSMQAPDGLLMVKHGDSHPTERADLHGKRFVSSVEVEEGRRLAESLVKQLTGGDSIRARRMREDHWQFAPTHKLWLAANHKPTIVGTDHAIWRRVKLIPFTVTIPDADQDKELLAKLKAERPGILAWAVRGCLDWQQHGLGEPDEVKAVTAEYRDEMDVLGAFVAELCVEGERFTAKASAVYAAYHKWCQANGEDAVSQRRFGLAMSERGFQRYASNGKWYRGIALLDDRTEF